MPKVGTKAAADGFRRGWLPMARQVLSFRGVVLEAAVVHAKAKLQLNPAAKHTRVEGVRCRR